jgi:hypothetical protein
MNYILRFIRNRKILIPILLFCLFIALYFGIRPILLNKAIESVNDKLKYHKYSANWDGAKFKGINKVFARDILIHSQDGNNEVHIDSVSVRVRILPVLTGNIRIHSLDCRSLVLNYTSEDSIKTTSTKPDTNVFFENLQEIDLAEFVYHHIRRILNYAPSGIDLGMMEIRYTYAGHTSVMELKHTKFNKGKFDTFLIMGSNDSSVTMNVSGVFDRKKSLIEIHVINRDTGLLPFPVLRDKFGLAAGFDSVDFSVNLEDRNRHKVNIIGDINLVGFEINGERLSTGNIVFDRFTSNYQVQIGPDFIEIDSLSHVLLNYIGFNPYLKLSLANDPEFSLKILRQKWNANDFFRSLPQGMFTSLIGTRAEGDLDFFLDFSVNLKMPDSLKFDIKLKGKDINIISFGSDDYRILNRDFTHKVYSGGKLIASFPVNSENHDYVAYENISPFVRAAVMTSEDGSFFYHNGFNPGAFRESIAANIREKRFARGGSTISMQLVKNVFLIRNKTIARKIEEALIVWLIENLNLVSKQRMYEVYLNIIEWGPGVYGIGQASRYYFSKDPSELTLQESVFLASIVPRPRWFKYTFEANGRPKSFFAVYFNRLKELMVQKEFISPSDTIGIIPIVTLNGPATQVFDTAFYRGSDLMISPLEPLTTGKISNLKISE